MKRLFLMLSALMLAAASAEPASAQYPQSPIRIIVPVPAGGLADSIARIYADGIQKVLGQPVVVENRTGASGSIGAAAVKSSAPDGYTLGLALPLTHALPPPGQDVALEPGKDFTPIALLSQTPMPLVVRPTLGVSDMKSFVALAKQKEGGLKFGSTGVASGIQLYTLWLEELAGIKGVHVPYRGDAPALNDLVAGSIDYLISPGALSYVKNKQLSAIATTGDKRWFVMPDVPTLKELGYDYRGFAWMGLVGPGGLPEDIVKKLSDAVNAAMKDPAVMKRMESLGAEISSNSPSDFREFVLEEQGTFARVMKAHGIQMPR